MGSQTVKQQLFKSLRYGFYGLSIPPTGVLSIMAIMYFMLGPEWLFGENYTEIFKAGTVLTQADIDGISFAFHTFEELMEISFITAAFFIAVSFFPRRTVEKKA